MRPCDNFFWKALPPRQGPQSEQAKFPGQVKTPEGPKAQQLWGQTHAEAARGRA